jgi:death on curing protein
MTVLTLEQLLEIHALLVQNTGGSSGLRDLGRLEAVIATQTQSVFDEELYPDLESKAAAMIRGIIADHPFVDGNKRTGMLSGLTLLKINGAQSHFQKQEIEDFAVKIAVEHLEVSAISAWLQHHSLETSST